MKSFDQHPVEPTRVYTKDGIIYVPHYTQKGIFVGPGSITYKESFLRDRCIPSEAMLWVRNI